MNPIDNNLEGNFTYFPGQKEFLLSLFCPFSKRKFLMQFYILIIYHWGYKIIHFLLSNHFLAVGELIDEIALFVFFNSIE